MKLRVKVSRAQMQEMLESERADGGPCLLTRILSDNQLLDAASDHTVSSDDSQYMSNDPHTLQDQSTSRRPKRSGSLQRLLRRPPSSSKADQDDEAPRRRSASKGRNIARTNSFKTILKRVCSNGDLASEQNPAVATKEAPQRTLRRGRSPCASKRDSVKVSQAAKNELVGTAATPAVRSKSLNPTASDRKRERHRQKAAAKIKELDDILAGRRINPSRSTITTTPPALKASASAYHDGAACQPMTLHRALQTPGRRSTKDGSVALDRRFRSKSLHRGHKLAASTAEVLKAYDSMMEDFGLYHDEQGW
jgi:hypothetical protein